MADLVLKDGRIASVSDEDYEWALTRSWRPWRQFPNGPELLVNDETVSGRRFRVRLLREVAVRMDPSLAKAAQRMRVTPKNGDPFDARRENLAIYVRPLRRGRPFRDPRPKGFNASRAKPAGFAKPLKKGSKHGASGSRSPSPLWNPGV